MSIRSEQLLPASFRGVPFEVTSGSLRAGRRTVVHEYPQRDKPYVEDLGKATRQITIEAFVVGDDYIARGTALLAEIEKPGSGTLIHPWLGEMTVTVTSVSELKFDTGLGAAYLTFVATEAGDLEFPVMGIDTQTLDVILPFATPSTFHGVAKHAIFAGVQRQRRSALAEQGAQHL